MILCFICLEVKPNMYLATLKFCDSGFDSCREWLLLCAVLARFCN